MAEVGLVSGETLSFPETDAKTILERINSSGTEFAALPIAGRANWVRVAHVVYVRDSEMPVETETSRPLSEAEARATRFGL